MIKSAAGKITRGMALRMFADGLMVQCSLLAALSLSWVYHVLIGDLSKDQPLSWHFTTMILKWSDSGWPLTLICVGIFYLSGFYTFGRFYQWRYNALIVFLAVCLSYLIYGFVHYAFLGGGRTLATSALILSWGISVVLLIGGRLWLQVWKTIADPGRDREMGTMHHYLNGHSNGCSNGR
jgi:FlaA1/EpsC-like NDP-sugar epimerase